MKLQRADLSVPFDYRGGDEFFYGMIIKGMLDNGWFLRNDFVGMPTGLDLHDFALPDNLHLVLIKLMSVGSGDYAVLMNLYFLLTFPLNAVTALFVMRKFGVSAPPAAVGALLFTFLPYHFLRGESHLFLSAYYLVPLMIMVTLWMCRDDRVGDTCPTGESWSPQKWTAGVAICMAMASGGAYYAFFAGVFLVVAGVHALVRQWSIRRLIRMGILLSVLGGAFMVNISPSLLYAYQHGANGGRERMPREAEAYGARITQILLPINDHRVSYLAEMRGRYRRGAPFINENEYASLGIVGGVGFLALLGWVIWRKPSARTPSVFDDLSRLNIAGLLMATIGGFGALFAFLVFPQMRSLNRISVYIAFVSLFGVALLLEDLGRRWSRSRRGRLLYYFVLLAVLLVGVLDQTTPVWVPPYAQAKADHASDAAFVKEIEATTSKNSMIFQLPYVPFPEGPFVQRMWPYDHLRGYLHSDTLRWSFGAMRGRKGAAWQQGVVGRPVRELVETLRAAGFGGIYLDRYGYGDRGAAIEAELAELVDSQPLVSANRRLAFYHLGLVGACRLCTGTTGDEDG